MIGIGGPYLVLMENAPNIISSNTDLLFHLVHVQLMILVYVFVTGWALSFIRQKLIQDEKEMRAAFFERD